MGQDLGVRGGRLPSVGPNQERGTAVMGQNLRVRWRHARDWALALRITEVHAKTMTWRQNVRRGALIIPLPS